MKLPGSWARRDWTRARHSGPQPTVVPRPDCMYTQKAVTRERLLSNAYLVSTSKAFKIKLGRSFVCGSDSHW